LSISSSASSYSGREEDEDLIVKPLRIGCVKYLNARPLIHGWDGAVDFDHPAALCRKLERRELDVALVSSLEFLRHPIYRIVDDVSISSRGCVYSVIVAHREELSRLEKIELDPASETSVVLLSCLLAERGLAPELLERGASAIPEPETRGLAGADRWISRLLIGDQAIQFRQSHPSFDFWDLGQAWKKITNLPFVFALWLIRPEVENADKLAAALRSIRDQNLKNLDDLVFSQSEFSPEFCRKYYREHLFFDFGEPEKAGLREFHRRCLLNHIDVAPKLNLPLV
jgi:chorismate dehydratase